MVRRGSSHCIAFGKIKSQLVTSSMESCGNLDKGIPAFRKEGNQYREIHEDKVAYASLNARGEIQLEATPPFNDGAVLSETHDMEHISRNDSSRHTSVHSKTNTKTDKRIENSHDDGRGITGFFKDGNQYKELHEDMVALSFPFYEIAFDILL